jgi:hypothetical protein
MALVIGGGITIGGGVSVVEEAGGGAGNLGSITVASQPYSDGMESGTSYGASNGTFGAFLYPAFGTVTGGTSFLIYVNVYGGATQLYLINGIYSGFGVVEGAINGDTSGSQSFTIGGVTAILSVQSQGPSQYKYQSAGDPFGLAGKVGQTIAVTFNP